MSVVSELYKRALHGDTGALAELVANKDKEELYKSVVRDGKRAIDIITVPRFNNVRKALLKMQQVGVYANLDTLGGEAKQIIFSTTTGIDMEDIEKLFISYIEEAEREENKSKQEESKASKGEEFNSEESFFEKAKDFFKNYNGPKRDHTEEKARTKAMQDSYESSGFIKGLITGAATVAGIVGGIYLYKKFTSDDEKDDTDIVIISGD